MRTHDLLSHPILLDKPEARSTAGRVGRGRREGARGGRRGEVGGGRVDQRWCGLTEVLGHSVLLDEPEAQSAEGVAL